MSVRSFESQAGITQGVLSNAIKKGTDISSTNLSKIIDTYNEFNAHWLLTGDGEMIINDDTPPEALPAVVDTIQELPSTNEWEYVNNDNQGKIPVIHELSFATINPEDPASIKADEFYYIKEFRNADFLMRMQGDYMSPKYRAGDLLACRNVKYSNFYQWGRIYALLTCHQGLVIGRVYEHFQNTILMRVMPINQEYPEWVVPLDEIVRVALVVGSISMD